MTDPQKTQLVAAESVDLLRLFSMMQLIADILRSPIVFSSCLAGNVWQLKPAKYVRVSFYFDSVLLVTRHGNVSTSKPKDTQ